MELFQRKSVWKGLGVLVSSCLDSLGCCQRRPLCLIEGVLGTVGYAVVCPYLRGTCDSSGDRGSRSSGKSRAVFLGLEPLALSCKQLPLSSSPLLSQTPSQKLTRKSSLTAFSCAALTAGAVHPGLQQRAGEGVNIDKAQVLTAAAPCKPCGGTCGAGDARHPSQALQRGGKCWETSELCCAA